MLNFLHISSMISLNENSPGFCPRIDHNGIFKITCLLIFIISDNLELRYCGNDVPSSIPQHLKDPPTSSLSLQW